MIALGIDTSNYTTSAATFDGDGFLMSRKIIDVKKGERGIRQSDGVFIHNRELPLFIEERLKEAKDKINTVGVSARPRNIQGSYMPVFTVGHGYARAIASAAGISLHEFSHQDGHIMAGIYSVNRFDLLNNPFISVHLSGGTTEILVSEYDGYKFKNKIIGGTLDISVGQLIDRIGVQMGLKFPCGCELDRLAAKTDEYDKLPFSVKGSFMNLSGVETKLIRNADGISERLARTVLVYIKDVLSMALNNSVKETGIKKILIAGGVASNSVLREGLIKKVNADIVFASKELSTDNAVGIAVLAHMAEGDVL